MAFPLLLLCIILLFNRPGDWMPALAGLPLFQFAILGCLSLSIGKFICRLQATSPARTPVCVCVNGLLVMAIVSGVANASSLDVVYDFAKAWVLFFLILALVDSPQRLKTILICMAVSIFGIGLLMVLDRHTGMFGGISAVAEGEVIRAEAIGGAMFDANDTAALLVVAVLIFFATSIDSKSVILRCVSISFTIVSLYAMQLCNSRGSLLALLAGLATYVYLRWGTGGLKWAALLLPVFLAIVATDRMTDVAAIQHGTGQSRMQFWSMALSLFFRNPIIGIGPGEFANRIGMACHNSFMQAFAELGFVGGAFFIGAFYYAIKSSYRMAATFKYQNLGPESNYSPLIYIMPTLLIAYSVSLLTLNHLYGCHTYLLLAVGTVATLIYRTDTTHDYSNCESGFFTKLATISCLFIVSTYVGPQNPKTPENNKLSSFKNN